METAAKQKKNGLKWSRWWVGGDLLGDDLLGEVMSESHLEWWTEMVRSQGRKILPERDGSGVLRVNGGQNDGLLWAGGRDGASKYRLFPYILLFYSLCLSLSLSCSSASPCPLAKPTQLFSTSSSVHTFQAHRHLGVRDAVSPLHSPKVWLLAMSQCYFHLVWKI